MKNYRWHRIHVCSFLAILLVLGSVCPLSAAQTHKQAQPLKPGKSTSKPLAANVSGFGITAIDVKNGTLKLGWLNQPSVSVPLQEIVVTRETRFKQAESGLKIEDIKVGDVLLEVRHDDFDHKRGNASFDGRDLVVRSLNPLILDFKGGYSSSGTPAKLKPGQTPQQAMMESMDSDEVRGIGVFVPHRAWHDPETGKYLHATTIVLQEPSHMTFTRSTASKPLALSDFTIGQNITYDATVRPDGKATATTIWLIVEKP